MVLTKSSFPSVDRRPQARTQGEFGVFSRHATKKIWNDSHFAARKSDDTGNQVTDADMPMRIHCSNYEVCRQYRRPGRSVLEVAPARRSQSTKCECAKPPMPTYLQRPVKPEIYRPGQEYGDVQGIVTFEDVLEEIVGDIFDESDRREEELWPQDDGSLHALGTIELRKLCGQLDIKLPPDTEASRLGGLVMELLGRIPVKGDTVEWNDCRLEVLSASQWSAELVSIKKII